VRFTRHDLLNAEERITQVQAQLDRQRARLATLDPGSPDAHWVAQVLAAMERMLRHFQEYRNRIAGELCEAG
jgi:hypothetical protein